MHKKNPTFRDEVHVITEMLSWTIMAMSKNKYCRPLIDISVVFAEEITVLGETKDVTTIGLTIQGTLLCEFSMSEGEVVLSACSWEHWVNGFVELKDDTVEDTQHVLRE